MPEQLRNSVPDFVKYVGRPGDSRLGEWVEYIDTSRDLSKYNKKAVVIMGCPDDSGVILNRGRAGAKDGPNNIRKHLYKMTPPMDFAWEEKLALFDIGNVIVSEDILETHRRTHALAKEIAVNGGTIIALGGGHDFAAPNFLGFSEGRREISKKREVFGLTNVNPHLDVRELENNRPNSGTAFRQILESEILSGNNFVEFGVRSNRNSRSHFQFCKKNKVNLLTLGELRNQKVDATEIYQKALTVLSKKCTSLATTFDMDSCFEAEGESAAPVLGFSAWELCAMARIAGRDRKVGLFEIAEVAPPLDTTERSSRIAAEIIYAFLYARAQSLTSKS